MTKAAKLDNRREIELAEGVHIHLCPAGLFPRLLARAIDATIWTAIYFAALLIFSMVRVGKGLRS
jgi:hypothetical protein